MKNHRLSDIYKYHQQHTLKRDVLIAGYRTEFPAGHPAPLVPRFHKISTYLHDGDIDMNSICSLNIGVEEGEVKSIIAGTKCRSKTDPDFHKECASKFIHLN